MDAFQIVDGHLRAGMQRKIRSHRPGQFGCAQILDESGIGSDFIEKPKISCQLGKL